MQGWPKTLPAVVALAQDYFRRHWRRLLLIRERLNLTAKMHSHTAAQRMSAGLLCALPFAVGLGFWIVKPEYIRAFVVFVGFAVALYSWFGKK